MEFFETPSWDGDNGADNLSHDLFRPHIVSRAKIPKKRKRNKYPRSSLDLDNSSALECSNNDQNAKVKKNKASNQKKTSNDHDQGLVSNERMEFPNGIKSNDDNVRSNNAHSCVSKSPASSCTVGSSNSTSSPTKRKKKRKVNHANSEMKSDHNLKNLKNKLNLNLKVNSSDGKASEHRYSDANRHKHEKVNDVVSSQMGIANISGKKTKKKCSAKGNQDQVLKCPSKKKKKNCAQTERKCVEVAGTHSLNVSLKQSEHFTIPHHTDVDASSHIAQLDSHASSTSKKMKKKLKEITNDSLEKNREARSGSSSHLLETPPLTLSKKRKDSLNHEAGAKKRKNSEKGDSMECFDTPSEYLSSQGSYPKLQKDMDTDDVGISKTTYSSEERGTSGGNKKKLTLREKMREKLRGSRFRFLNEQMYKSKSEETKKFFGSDRKSFEAYHEGYKQQLMQWPIKPVDAVIKYLKKKPTNYVIADFGCGDAHIAQSLPNQVHSFDYVALNDYVTACDMAHTPLSSGSVDVAVFCLSLMGSNLSDYIREANRVLKVGGILKIAEVESRFDDVVKFIRVISKYGFLCISRDLTKDVFYLFVFKKEKNIKDGKVLPPIELRDCSYKKR